MMIEALRIGPSSTLLRVRAVYRFHHFGSILHLTWVSDLERLLLRFASCGKNPVMGLRAVQQKLLHLLKERGPAQCDTVGDVSEQLHRSVQDAYRSYDACSHVTWKARDCCATRRRAVRTDRNVKGKAGDFVSPIEHLQIEMWLHEAEENFQRRPETLSTLGSNSRGEAGLPRRNAVNLPRWM
ncbi:hypothetical protein HBH61_083890 [Parastagonospora nodorum]|nr:hypothetical protein HBH61_083890 [Parastagonospora nodorum]KAH5436001.1 hypothetical protein HBI47_072370 [Parastagonospora nodorum]